jgi:hypothetical protein
VRNASEGSAAREPFVRLRAIRQEVRADELDPIQGASVALETYRLHGFLLEGAPETDFAFPVE